MPHAVRPIKIPARKTLPIVIGQIYMRFIRFYGNGQSHCRIGNAAKGFVYLNTDAFTFATAIDNK
jgi:hypothetical protein